MKWKKRKREIERLRKKHPVLDSAVALPPRREPDGIAYPSLTSTGVSRFSSNKRPALSPPSSVIVGTPHKQGMMVMTREELPWAGGKKS
jgi:hypothetical protein